MARPKFSDSAVAGVFASYPSETKARLHALRDEIYQVAAEINGVGLIEEALLWQQPSYLTQETGSGSPVRIDVIKRQPNKYVI